VSYNYCTCVKGDPRKESSKIRLVKVDHDGICQDCGFYAVASPVKVKDSFELYNLLRRDKEEVSNEYIAYEDSLIATAVKSQENRAKDGLKYSNKTIKE
jgi:hypothetical protein